MTMAMMQVFHHRSIEIRPLLVTRISNGLCICKRRRLVASSTPASSSCQVQTSVHVVRFFGSSTVKHNNGELLPPTSLLHFHKTRLAYPLEDEEEAETSFSTSGRPSSSSTSSCAFETQPFDWTILKPLEGSTKRRSNTNTNTFDDEQQLRRRGYLLLGRNGSGKSLVGRALMETNKYRSYQYELQHQQHASSSSSSSSSSSPPGEVTSTVPPNSYVKDGRIDVEDINKWHSQSVAYVSFDSHQELLQQRSTKIIGRNDNEDTSSHSTSGDGGSGSSGGSITAFRAIAGDGVSKLNKASQFLVVRFGLYPLLHRPVSTLSTGEIRKVLLIRALSKRPHLLILDNAFDGLDVPSREILKDIVKRTLKGFTQDILVHDVAAKATANTQVILMTHRIEEMILPDIENVTSLSLQTPSTTSTSTSLSSNSTFRFLEHGGNDNRYRINEDGISTKNITRTTESNDGWVEEHIDEDNVKHLQMAQSIMLQALGVGSENGEMDSLTMSHYESFPWDDPTLPSTDKVMTWWEPKTLRQRQQMSDDDDESSQPILVQTRDLSIRRGAEGEVTLLHNLDWTVRQGERWLVGGGNGAGKSTLSRLLAQPEEEKNEFNTGTLDICSSATTAWVSTESHLRQIKELESGGKMNMTVKELLNQLSNHPDWHETVLPVVEWLGLIDTTAIGTNSGKSDTDLLSRRFLQLSQGQQKMVLIAAALASQPSLLVLDEPCQGLDILNRQRMLTVVNRICESTSMSFVYITHHYEEVLPSVGHALHLKDRRAVFNGPIDGYNPSSYHDKL